MKVRSEERNEYLSVRFHFPGSDGVSEQINGGRYPFLKQVLWRRGENHYSQILFYRILFMLISDYQLSLGNSGWKKKNWLFWFCRIYDKILYQKLHLGQKKKINDLHFNLIELVINMVNIIDYIHYLFNRSKKCISISDTR